MAVSCCVARQTSDDFPYRRGAKMTTFWPFRTSAVSSRSSASRSVKASSSARSPKLNGLTGFSATVYTLPCVLDLYAKSVIRRYANRRRANSDLMETWSDREYADPVPYLRHRAELIVSLGPRLEPGDRLVDLACGDGGLADFLPGIEYVGVDADPKMVEEARGEGPRRSSTPT